MSKHGPLPRGIQHIGVTVPDLEAATRFLVEGLGAKVAYDGLTPDDEPRQGREVEHQLGLPSGAAIHRQRMFVLGEGPGLEASRSLASSGPLPGSPTSGSTTSPSTATTSRGRWSDWSRQGAVRSQRCTTTAGTRTRPATGASTSRRRGGCWSSCRPSRPGTTTRRSRRRRSGCLLPGTPTSVSPSGAAERELHRISTSENVAIEMIREVEFEGLSLRRGSAPSAVCRGQAGSTVVTMTQFFSPLGRS